MNFSRLWLAALVVLLAACAEMPYQEPARPTKPTTQRLPTRPVPASDAAKPRPETTLAYSRAAKASKTAGSRQPTASAAVVALLEKAKAEANAGEGEAAAATLERAIEIEPKNPWLWHRLAVLRLQQGLWQPAVDLATKSSSLSGGNARLLGGNWEVIANARQGLGDAAGAQQAKAKSQSYFGKSQSVE
jgi:tetratricopeptide (TPR) repeat protein